MGPRNILSAQLSFEKKSKPQAFSAGEKTTKTHGPCEKEPLHNKIN